MDSGSAYYGLISYSFLCPNGTMFHQKYFICDWWYNVDCRASVDFYDLNNNLFKVRVSSASQVETLFTNSFHVRIILRTTQKRSQQQLSQPSFPADKPKETLSASSSVRRTMKLNTFLSDTFHLRNRDSTLRRRCCQAMVGE